MKKRIRFQKGVRIPPRKAGQLLSTLQMDAGVAATNIIFNLEARFGSKPDLIISDQNAILVIPISALPTLTAESFTMMRIKAISTDSLTCRTWDGAVEGSTDFAVAKTPDARRSIASTAHSGLTWGVTYEGTDPNNRRTLTFENGTKDRIMTQRLISPYAINGIILAGKSTNGTGLAVAPEYIELVPSRRWEIDLQEWDVCDSSNNQKKAMFQSTLPYDP